MKARDLQALPHKFQSQLIILNLLSRFTWCCHDRYAPPVYLNFHNHAEELQIKFSYTIRHIMFGQRTGKRACENTIRVSLGDRRSHGSDYQSGKWNRMREQRRFKEENAELKIVFLRYFLSSLWYRTFHATAHPLFPRLVRGRCLIAHVSAFFLVVSAKSRTFMREYRTCDLRSRRCWPEEQERNLFTVVKPSIPAFETMSQIRDSDRHTCLATTKNPYQQRLLKSVFTSDLDVAADAWR